jgi:Domain of unknown function (DUF6457)
VDVNTLEEWTAAVCAELGIDAAVDRSLVLDLARDVAHGVARPAAPLTTYLVGLAAGRSPDVEVAARDAVRRVTALAENWPSAAQQ